MTTQLGDLVSSLLYEGYALYPYTPGATKNATPTPFGIVYPPSYAARSGATFDHLQMQCLLRAEREPEVRPEVYFLQSVGERHTAVERRVGVGAFAFGDLHGDVTLTVEEEAPGLWRTTLRVQNTSAAPDGLARAEALERSLLSTHALLRARSGQFVSPLEVEGCVNVNTWPVLASPSDDAVLGAAIMLPDHPQLAPQSRGALFDNTEIEEALRLHLLALSDGEREEIAREDPVVREMVDGALKTTPEEIFALHGVMRPVDKDPREGEEKAVVGGVSVTRGAKLVLRLGDRIDPYDRMLDGRTATLERIYLDYDGRTYLGVTVDSDPMQEVMRESGRYLFFFAGEVEVAAETANQGGATT
ncbi:MAG: hypothetical protein QOF27_2536 [Gaiellaceae bacterium]|nr:hypothetical protein [Gaiellaceae bacterium]